MDKDIVVPGDFLTVEEEYAPGKNTFEDTEGNVFSSKLGLKQFDDREREVSIKEKKPSNEVIEPGSIITGRVSIIKESFAVIDILSAEKNNVKQVPLFSSAKLMISKVAKFHVMNLRDEFRVGDIIKAKVINVTKYGIDITTAYPELGVIKAFCCVCRSPLDLYDKTLKCSKCGSVEKRKLSSELM
ncbi:MAG: exosome complex RNA-binding protein Csl4 [archaeon]